MNKSLKFIIRLKQPLMCSVTHVLQGDVRPQLLKTIKEVKRSKFQQAVGMSNQTESIFQKQTF